MIVPSVHGFYICGSVIPACVGATARHGPLVAEQSRDERFQEILVRLP
jgi:hypothetical protein